MKVVMKMKVMEFIGFFLLLGLFVVLDEHQEEDE